MGCPVQGQGCRMLDDNVWPPNPTLLDPLTEYDDVIAAKLAALSETKTGPNKLLLIKALRDEEEMDLRQAYTLVTSYYARNGTPVQTRASKVRAWLGCLPPLALLCFAGTAIYSMKRRDEILSHPHHHAALIALDREEIVVLFPILILMLGVITTILTTRVMTCRKK